MSIPDWLATHSITDTIVIFWILSAAVNALPEPGPNSHGLYSWLYLFLTALVGHLSDAINRHRAQPSSVPTAPQGEKQ